MSWADPRYAEIVELLGTHSGMTFTAERQTFVEAAVRRAMRNLHVRELDTFVTRLRSGSKAMNALVAEATVGETYFLRDPQQFEVLRNTIFPAIAGTEGRNGSVYVWSAGCATGEEPYSLAILAEELGFHDRVRVLATDISHNALDTARRGTYGGWSFRGASEPWRNFYFSRRADKWTIAPRFRSRVDFREHNLMQPVIDFAPGGFDLIICRNVLIYFDRATVARVVRSMTNALASNGWLILGAADPLAPLDEGLDAVMTSAGVAYRRRATGPVAAPPFVPAPEPAPLFIKLPSLPAIRARRTEGVEGPDIAEVLARVRSLFHGGEREPAQLEIAAAVAAYPLEVELYVLLALSMLDVGRPGEALAAVRRALFLDRFLAVGHLVHGKALRLLGRPRLAKRALRRCQALAGARPIDEIVRFGEGTSAGTLAASAAAELRMIEREVGAA